MVTNREGQRLELSELSDVRDEDDSYSLTMQGGWSLYMSKDECGDFVPRVGDWILVSYEGFNTIAGIIIEGRVLRAKTSKQVKAQHEQWVKNIRLKRLEEYLEKGDALKERVKRLPEPLRQRMNRFAEKEGVEFWIESAGYEMHVMEGAAALLRKVKELGFINSVDNPELSSPEIKADPLTAVQWIDEWWALNTKEHDYNYTRQMELVPDFGEGHSGNTAGAAYAIAKALLRGEDV